LTNAHKHLLRLRNAISCGKIQLEHRFSPVMQAIIINNAVKHRFIATIVLNVAVINFKKGIVTLSSF